MSNINRANTQAHDAQLIAGIQKHLTTVPSLPLAGSTFAPADLVKLIQSRTDLAATIANNAATWHASLASEQALNAKLTPILRGLRQYLFNNFGATSPVIADFGLTAPRSATKTPEQKAAAAAKAKATRVARNTMGKKQKKDVKGAVKATLVVTPLAAPTPAAPTPATPGPTVTPTQHAP